VGGGWGEERGAGGLTGGRWERDRELTPWSRAHTLCTTHTL
jgi:hypothetical protein